MTRPWDAFITPQDREVFAAAGYGAAEITPGRAAVLVIDMMVAFLGDHPQPLLASVRRYPNSCGAPGWEVAGRLVSFLDAARKAAVPVVYTVKDLEHPGAAVAAWGRTQQHQVPNVPPEAYATVVPHLVPYPADLILRKTKPSAFFATPLLQHLFARGVEQLVCCGATTSGCVCATAVDAFSHGFTVLVSEDGVCDRGEASHAIGLFDLAQKYAHVAPLRALEVVLGEPTR